MLAGNRHSSDTSNLYATLCFPKPVFQSQSEHDYGQSNLMRDGIMKYVAGLFLRELMRERESKRKKR